MLSENISQTKFYALIINEELEVSYLACGNTKVSKRSCTECLENA